MTFRVETTTTWSAPTRRDPVASALRGFRGRCPACGKGRLFGRFLKVVDRCEACGTTMSHHRADDFPPYIVMFLVGHVVGYGIYISETRYEGLPIWLHAMLWPALAVGLSLALLQPIKGAVVGLQYGLGMHGFGAPATGVMGAEDIDVGNREGRAAEAVLRHGGSGEALAESTAKGRRDADRSRPAG